MDKVRRNQDECRWQEAFLNNVPYSVVLLKGLSSFSWGMPRKLTAVPIKTLPSLVCKPPLICDLILMFLLTARRGPFSHVGIPKESDVACSRAETKTGDIEIVDVLHRCRGGNQPPASRILADGRIGCTNFWMSIIIRSRVKDPQRLRSRQDLSRQKR